MKYHIWLRETAKLPCDKACRLISELDSAEAVYNAPIGTLNKIVPLTERDREGLSCRDLSHAEKIIAKCSDRKIGILTFSDSAYPQRLRETYSPPLVLYIRGKLPDVDNLPLFAIVGSRCPVLDSKSFAEDMAETLTKAGVTIVSGLADGIDTCAARGALKSGSTIAVLGTAIDNPYPRYNGDLYREIWEKGAVVSEYPPGVRTYPACFIERNRIIAALSIGVLVVQAGKKSGSLATARFCEEYGRYVFVSPGLPTREEWQGSNELLRSGAFYTVATEDILSQYESIYNFRKIEQSASVDTKTVCMPAGLSHEEALIYSALVEEKRADELSAVCNLAPERVSSLLTMMELMGLVEQSGAQIFRRK